MKKAIVLFTTEKLSERQIARREKLVSDNPQHSYFWITTDDKHFPNSIVQSPSSEFNFRSVSTGNHAIALIDIALPLDYLAQVLTSPVTSHSQLWAIDCASSELSIAKLFMGIVSLPQLQYRAGLFPTSFTSLIDNTPCSNGIFMMAELIARSIESDMTIKIAGAVPPGASSSDSERARILHHLLLTYSIQELYPLLPWDTNQKEIGATCYQKLAAAFIKLADYRAAKECLHLSDSLLESPRSQGLKALISVAHGENLGAVANLITSLQQYEKYQLIHPGSDGFDFHPKDMNVLGSNLCSGLKALDHNDQRQAISYLARAICEFDSFYDEQNLQRLFEQMR
jgi:hypothetical protein